MPVSNNDVIRATARMTGNEGQAIQNVFYFRAATIGTQPDADVADDISFILDEMYDEIVGGMSDAMSFVDIALFNVTDNAPMSPTLWRTQTVGGDNNQPLAPGVAALVSLRTGVLRVAGRKYLGQFCEENITAARWTAGLLTILGNFAAGFLVDWTPGFSAAVWKPGVLDKDGNFWAFQEAIVSSNPAYQRRRRFGTGQ